MSKYFYQTKFNFATGFQVVKCFLILLSLLSVIEAKSQIAETDIKPAPFTIGGTAGAQMVSYSTTRQVPTRVPLSYSLSGDFNLSLYNVIQLPFSFIISEQERHFSQPFNQFGISPSYKWLKVHLGYRSLVFSPYTLNGYTFLGAGVEINTNTFRFAFISGRFNRALTGIAAIDTVNRPIFKRTGYCMKIGYGTESDHIDFIVLSARDQYTSLQSLDTTKGHPAENMVLGINLKESLAKNVFFDANYGFSFYTDNTNAKALADVADTFPVKIPRWGFLFTPRVNTKYYGALDASIGYKIKPFGLLLKYTRIDPGYQSMGSYSITSDVENITLNPSLNLWKSKFTASGSMGLQRDNLFHTKAVTSDRVIGSASVNLNPAFNYGISFQFNNYSSSQAPGLKVVNDTVRLAQVSRCLTLMPHYMLQRKKLVHTWMLVFLNQTLIDQNQFTSKFSQYQTRNTNLIYSVNIIKTRLSLNFSYNSSNTSTYYGETDYSGGTIGISKSIFKKHLNSALNFTYNATKFNGQNSGDVINVRLSEIYRIKQHSLNLSLYEINNNSTLSTRASFHELTASLGYYYNF